MQVRAKAKKNLFFIDFAERSLTCAKRKLVQVRAKAMSAKELLANAYMGADLTGRGLEEFPIAQA